MNTSFDFSGKVGPRHRRRLRHWRRRIARLQARGAIVIACGVTEQELMAAGEPRLPASASRRSACATITPCGASSAAFAALDFVVNSLA